MIGSPKDRYSSSAYVRKTNDQDIERRMRAPHEYRHAPPTSKARPSAVRVLSVEPRSLAGRVGLRPGDEIVEINGRPVLDVVDVQFRMAAFDEGMSLRTEDRTLTFIRREWEALGAEFEPIEPLVCDNDCVFCFVHQNPGNTRRSLRIKDEDYRLSFLFGNYLTLTNVGDEELERILSQRLSPLYISIHATEPELRARMLGNETYDGLDRKLDRLTEAGIQLHCQVVLCPGWNDGPHLDRTIRDLSRRFPGVRSLAIVPVGLTDHRRNLPRLDPVTPEYARKTIDALVPVQRRFETEVGTPFVFLGDEFYILAGRAIPGQEHYQEFPQIENGVGMVRSFLDDFSAAADGFPVGKGAINAVVATGTLFAPFLRAAVTRLDVGLRVVGVENRFWGGGIRVAGLLTGSDFIAACRDLPSEFLILPSESMIGDEGLFLDDMTLDDVQLAVGRPVIRSGYSATDFLEVLQGLI